ISRADALKLHNRIWPVLDDDGEKRYVLALDVFHQLHCLVYLIRMKLYPELNSTSIPTGHIKHCIGAIRQAFMCAVDITPVVWQWSDSLQEAEQRDDIPHVCRDFEKVKDWAKDHFVTLPDMSTWVDDDLDAGGN
ncbi:hypothetical protein C8J57DRAFT_1074195, partial [Mycena rebaudengoi]